MTEETQGSIPRVTYGTVEFRTKEGYHARLKVQEESMNLAVTAIQSVSQYLDKNGYDTGQDKPKANEPYGFGEILVEEIETMYDPSTGKPKWMFRGGNFKKIGIPLWEDRIEDFGMDLEPGKIYTYQGKDMFRIQYQNNKDGNPARVIRRLD